MPQHYKLPRREFLKRSAQTVAAIAATAGASSAGAKQGKKPEIPALPLGKTGRKLPILGYGGAALPKMWGNPLSTADRIELVRYVYDKGIRYFDTAGNYAESQTILGKGLKDVRKGACLVSKVETTDPAEVRRSVEKSLKELQTDYLDGILIHGTPGIQQMSVKRAMEIHKELVKLRDQRTVRFIGLSAHGYFDKALALISTGGFDQCMLAYGYLPRGYDQIFSPRSIKLRDQCLDKAHDLKMAVVAMKVVGAGLMGAWARHIAPGFDKRRLPDLPGAAIRYVLKDKRINMLAIGMRLKQEIDANIKTFTGDTTFTKADLALLEEFAPHALKSKAMSKMKVE